jgi:flagellar hook protein FlgE
VIDALNSALSGLQAASAQLNVTANNIANVNTPGYSTEQANLVSAPGGGVDVVGVQTIGQPVNLATQLVNLTQSKMLYDANGAVLRAADQMYGTLLNVLDTDDRYGDWDRS